MRTSKGVEWALHTLLNLDMLGGGPVGSGRLAQAHALPASYLNKQLQQLVRAGLLTSVPGPRGGFRLARPLTDITLRDVVEAVEGDAELFQCCEIRCRGSVGELSPPPTDACAVKLAMQRADHAWREALQAQSLAGIREELDRTPHIGKAVRAALG
ncbi:Rrf2 family transcriptional regulator [Streptomyces sp. RM72]|uniref:RrF2 family transcriptional regulator n=1 Tax=Streptomyces sp. RM72 TaxID=1115510 RepID=UPI001B3795A1|nr:Rrf2 family transcriptional regulator [Streptomyces sp. RM72]MBQ0889630.1 Rrf2 family transcriptional regulator [Streptomyces sp. RM72]